MPIISMFYGVVIRMFHFDDKKHHAPHIHVVYQNYGVVIAIPSGKVLDGKIPKGKMKLVQAWIELHQDELMADWELAKNGEEVFKIKPLK
ncbi:MAG: DUF4160 domain-containing protein [Gammaproteobacteria bacterium]|nr:DUF4160 domain-containing protein [Gammaproteobacteria bacterium]